MNTTTAPSDIHATPRPRWVRGAWLVAGGLGLTALGVAAGLAWHPTPAVDMAAPGAIVAPKASLANNEALVDATDRPADGTAAHSTPGTPVPPKSAARTAPRDARSGTRVASTNAPRGEATSSAQAAPVCATCGVVEGVHAVTQKGQGTGLGAVAGGVVGGAVGNQMGHGNGRAAMTVLGALGGGLAGHEIEKRARSETVYDVRVRMDDGSVRTLRQKTAPAAGARVTVEGNVLHVVPATHAPA